MSIIPVRQAAWTGAQANAGQLNQFLVTQPCYFGYNPDVPTGYGVDPFGVGSSFSGYKQLYYDGSHNPPPYTSVAQPITTGSAAIAVGVSLALYTTRDVCGDVSVSITNVDGVTGYPTSVKGQTIIPASLIYTATNGVGSTMVPTQSMYVPVFASLAASTTYCIVIQSNLYQYQASSPTWSGVYCASNPTHNGTTTGNTFGYPASSPTDSLFNVPLYPGSVTGTGLSAFHYLSNDGGMTWVTDSTTGNSTLPITCGFLVSNGSSVATLPTTVTESGGTAWTWYNYAWPTFYNPTSYSGAVPQINLITNATQRSPVDSINGLTLSDSQFTDSNGFGTAGRWTALANTTLQSIVGYGLAGALPLKNTSGATHNIGAWCGNDSNLNYVATNTSSTNTASFTIAAVIVPSTPTTPLRHVQVGYATTTNGTITFGSSVAEPSATVPYLYTYTFTVPASTFNPAQQIIPAVQIVATAANEIHYLVGAGIFQGSSVQNWQPSGLGIGTRRYTAYTSGNQLKQVQ